MSGAAQDLVEDCYAKYHTPAVLLDTTRRLIAFSAQPRDVADDVRRGLMDRAREGASAFRWLVAQVQPGDTLVQTPANPTYRLAPRTVVPLYAHNTAVGYLIAIDPESRITGEDVELWQPSLSVIALELQLERTESIRRRTVLSGLLSSVEDDRRQAADALVDTHSLDNRRPIRVVVARTTDDQDPGIARFNLTAVARGIAANVEHDLVAVLPADAAAIDAFCERVMRVGTFAHQGPLVGVGSATRGLDQAYRSHRQAKRALNLASLMKSDPVQHWDQLGSWRAVLMLRADDAIDAIDPRVLAMLDGEDSSTLAFVRDYLERGGDVTSLAAAQHIHRTTIYGRLKRLARVYEIDWTSADDRTTTIVGMRIAAVHGLGQLAEGR